MKNAMSTRAKRILDDEEISLIETHYKGQILPEQHENIFQTLWYYKNKCDQFELMEKPKT